MLESNGAAVEPLITVTDAEEGWRSLHWRLRSLAQQRVALEAQEVSWLIEAEETRLFSRLGYASMLEYMERELHWGPHAASERLRVARELMRLPLIAEQFASGEMCFSAVRELTRVATPENEEAYLMKAQGKTARDVERMVAGLKRGDDPEDEPDPRLIKKRIVLEVSAPVYARYRMTRTAYGKERKERLEDDEFLDTVLRRAEGGKPDEMTRPAVQVAVTTCKRCRKSAVNLGGEEIPIDDTMAELLTCDSVFVGDLETNELTRPKSHIPDALRRKVLIRDGFACVVPGCRSTLHVDAHHLKGRCEGGQHEVENLCSLCFGHHQHSHFGRLIITGEAPNLTFEWRPDEGVDTATTSPALEFEEVEIDLPPPRSLPMPSELPPS